MNLKNLVLFNYIIFNKIYKSSIIFNMAFIHKSNEMKGSHKKSNQLKF